MKILHETYGMIMCSSIIDENTKEWIAKACTELIGNPPIWLQQHHNRTQKHYIYFSCFGVNYKKRRNGYGRTLLQDTKNYYKGCVLYLGVGSLGEMTNEQLIKFYESEGFEIVENTGLSYPVMSIEL